MKWFLCSVRDAKAGVFNVPFGAPNLAVAQRQFAAMCKDPDSMLSKFPADFSLYCSGEFSDEDCTVESFDIPKIVCEGSDFSKGV
ncbi:MAG: nonstructural protein [Microvirus sp.]|nr:MAG: nonstructural protein [Microvirus sp.]